MSSVKWVLWLLVMLTPLAAAAQEHHHHEASPQGVQPKETAAPPAHRHDAAGSGGPAPIGVMGEHMHEAGGFMLSYRYGFMSMAGNRDDTARVGTHAVLSEYPVAPTRMHMEMHMLGAMWAPVRELTLTLMVPFVRLEMNHRTRMGTSFTTRTKGLGDISLAGLVRLLDRDQHHLHLNAGISFPTGSIREKDDTPAGRVRLPYPMQLGSGTYDLHPGLTYSGSDAPWLWGGQVIGTLRTGSNDRGYRLGNAWQATAWLARSWTSWFTTSLRLDWRDWNDIHGDDDALNPRMVPTADPDLRAGRRLEALLGASFLVGRGPLAGNRFAVEAGWPVFQSLRGPQLEADWRLVAGWQLGF